MGLTMATRDGNREQSKATVAEKERKGTQTRERRAKWIGIFRSGVPSGAVLRYVGKRTHTTRCSRATPNRHSYGRFGRCRDWRK